MEKKNLIVLVVTVAIVMVVAIISVNYYNESQREAFDLDFKKSYESHLSSYRVFEDVLDTKDFSYNGIKENKAKLKFAKKLNNESLEYLKDALTRTNNDDEKKVVNLMISNHELFEKEINLISSALDVRMQYNNGKISASQLLSKTDNIFSNVDETYDLMKQNFAEISQILNDNPELEQRLNSLGIKSSYLRGDIDN